MTAPLSEQIDFTRAALVALKEDLSDMRFLRRCGALPDAAQLAESRQRFLAGKVLLRRLEAERREAGRAAA